MTQPRINTIQRGGSRLYVHPETREKVPGVTSVLDMLPKPFLRYWAANKVAEAAVDMLGEVVGIAMKDRAAAVDMLKRAPNRDTRQAADLGDQVHDLYEAMAKGEKLGRVHPDMEPFVALFRGFEEQFQPKWLHLEATVWSETHGYAGSFDWLGYITDPETGERVLAIGDWKTTRSGVHEEVSIQMTAYSKADYILLPDGTKADLPEVEAGVVVHVRPEGGALVPARIDDGLFDIFLALKKVFEYEKEIKPSVLGQRIEIEPVAPKRRARRSA